MVKKVLFIGSKELGISALKTIHFLAPNILGAIVTIDDSKDLRCKLYEFKEFAKQAGKKIYILTRPSELGQIVQRHNPEMCIVVGWYWIVKQSLIDRVPLGMLGVHASLLPKYRGGSPLVWAVINGEKESGVSLFYFNRGIDTGDIVAQERFRIEDNDTIANILQKAELLTINILEKNYPLLLKGVAPRFKQNADGKVYSKRKPEDGRIDWNATNEEVHNFIRAQSYPYPGAFCFTENHKKLYIGRSRISNKIYGGMPGLIVSVNDNDVVVNCGKGAVNVGDLKFGSITQLDASKVLTKRTRLK